MLKSCRLQGAGKFGVWKSLVYCCIHSNLKLQASDLRFTWFLSFGSWCFVDSRCKAVLPQLIVHSSPSIAHSSFGFRTYVFGFEAYLALVFWFLMLFKVSGVRSQVSGYRLCLSPFAFHLPPFRLTAHSRQPFVTHSFFCRRRVS